MYSICRVCGDKAKGLNYNEFTCPSCKVFFHRYSSETKKFKCRKIGNCEIDIYTRTRCSACRLAKCLTLGMKRKLTKIVYNTNELSLVSFSHQNGLNSSNSKLVQILESKIVQQFTNEPNYKDETKLVDFSLEKLNLTSSNELNELEWKIIWDIRNASSVFGDECLATISRTANHISDCMFVPQIYFKWIAAFCSKIESFNALNRAEQMKVLKPFCFDVLSVRMGFMTDAQKSGFPMFWNYESNEAIFVCLNWYRNTHDKYDFIDFFVDYWFELGKEMENDFIIRDLLSVQLLFKSQQQLSCPEFVRYNYALYSHLLHKYLKVKYRENAERKYCALMKLMDQLDQIREYEVALFNSEVKCKQYLQIPHIIFEFYDQV